MNKRKALLFSILAAALYWTIESLVDVLFLRHEGSWLPHIFSHDLHEFYMRLLVSSLFASASYLVLSVSRHKINEAALSKSEERYRNLVENMPEVIYSLSYDGTITSLNPAFEKITGWSVPDWVGKQFMPLIHPDDLPSAMEIFQKILKGDSPPAYELRIIAKDGRYLIGEFTSMPQFENGKIAGSSGIVRNITERKNAEELIGNTNALLESINSIQSQFITEGNPSVLFDALLKNILSLTGSAYGFIGEVLLTDDGKPYLKTHAITNIAWNEETRAFYEKYAPNMEFFNLKTLFGEVIATGKPVISNNPAKDLRRGGLPEGHPPLNSFLGIPIYLGDKIVGMVGIANKTAGYDEKTIKYLNPILLTCGNIIGAYRNDLRRKQAEENLNKILIQETAILNNIPDIAWLKDKESRFIAANEPFGKACGWNPVDLIGKTDLDIWPKELAEKYIADDREVMESGRQKIVEEPLADKEGKIAWIETIKTPIHNEKGEIIGTTGIARDITDRRQTEKYIRDLSSRQEAILAAVPDIIMEVDNRKVYTWANRAGYDFFGEDVIGKEAAFYFEGEQDTYASVDAIFKGIETIFYVESWQRRKDGEKRLLAWWCRVLKDENGNVKGALSSALDITDRKKIEEDVYRIKQDWEETFNSITDMVTVHDKDWNIIRANKAAEKILKLPLLEVSKETKCFRYYHGTGKPTAGCPSCDCLKTGESALFEIFEPHLNMYIELRAIPRFDSNHNIIGLIHIVRDITDKKKLEEQLRQSQKMEAIGQLAGGIAHDFNNILTAIIGYGNILKTNLNENSTLSSYADNILYSSEKAAALTQGLLAFGRKQAMNTKPVDINAVVRGVEKLLLRVIGEHIEFKTDLAEGGLISLADSGQIEQALINLATNARDAMPQGGMLTITTELAEVDIEFLKAHSYGTPGKYALISVTDTGAGMDEKTREKIFEPFFTTKEVGKGTGLGLAMTYGIIKQHNGYINCYSEPGKGTTFKIYLPVVETEKPIEIKPVDAIEVRGGTEAILVAEDEEEVRKVTKMILESAGYTVITSVDGEDAVKKFSAASGHIQLVLLDVIMPKMNGKEVYNRIKKHKPEIKVLFSSGYPADFIHKQDILDEGLNFISKPSSPRDLLRKVREVLDK